jgi:PncC family amidohydrolase
MADRLTASAAKFLGAALFASGKTVAVAESCTGGLLGGAITSTPGSSLYFSGGVVAYGNPSKISVLGVPPDLIAARGAVSRDVALAMADGVLSLFRADLGIAVTGVAGPGGGSRGRPSSRGAGCGMRTVSGFQEAARRSAGRPSGLRLRLQSTS